MTRRVALVSCFVSAVLAGCTATSRSHGGLQPIPVLPDISGMSWMSGERLLVVHDSKRGEGELARGRVGLLSLPTGPAGVQYLPLDVRWPATGASHDLESVAHIPGTQRVLLAESGDNGDGLTGPRLFLTEVRGTRLELLETVEWPEPIYNVEATAIVEVHGQLVFVYAERNQGAATTALRWAPIQLDPLRFGEFETFRFATPTLPAVNRGIVALDADPSGRLYAAASFDPDVDGGPFRSDIYRLGRFVLGNDGGVRYDGRLPERIYTTDGVKIEALAIRPLADGTLELVYGTDDEDFGGIVRRLMLP
jgi:hypothetical protein